MEQKKWFQTGILYLLAFVVPALIMVTVLRQGGFSPYGDKTLFIMDMKGQYLEFFAYLRDMNKGDNSIFYSWSRSMGGNFLGLFAYYLASPLSFITIFFPLEKLDSAIALLTVLKIGLCGLSFCVYAHYLWRRGRKEGQENPFFILIFAVSYAMLSYNMVYSLCLMWLDGVILLPAVLLGVEKILDGKKGMHYLLSLAALFFCNYYTGYMVGIFTAIYLLQRVLSELSGDNWKVRVMQGVRFAVCTLLAFALSAPLVIPVAKDLLLGKLARDNWIPDQAVNFEFAELFGKLKNGVYDSITNAGLPAIYCGIVVLILALFFFFCGKISLREKIGAAAILALFAASFYYQDLDIAWHGFQYPTWFPYRYAFLCSFFLIYMAFRAACAMWQGSLAGQFREKKWFFACTQGVVAVLFVVMVIDVETNGVKLMEGLGNEFGYCSVQEYVDYVQENEPLVKEVQAQDNGFYRMNENYKFSLNAPMLFGYNGMSHYSSTFNEAVNETTAGLGIAQAHLWNSGYGATPILDSLFAVSYKLSDRYEPSCYERIGEGDNGGISIYRNRLALPMVYAASVENLNPDLNLGDPYSNQNQFLNTIAGKQWDVLTHCDYQYAEGEGDWSYTLTAESANPLYLYMDTETRGWADIYVNDVWYGNYFSSETVCSLYLGTYQPGEQVVVRVQPAQESVINYAVIAELDMERLEAAADELRDGGMQFTSHEKAKLKGNISVKDGQTIVTSIPYEDGWTVKLNGKEAETKKFADTFLAIQAEPGEYEITFSYHSPGFKEGMAAFILAVVLLPVYFILPGRRKLPGGGSQDTGKQRKIKPGEQKGRQSKKQNKKRM